MKRYALLLACAISSIYCFAQTAHTISLLPKGQTVNSGINGQSTAGAFNTIHETSLGGPLTDFIRDDLKSVVLRFPGGSGTNFYHPETMIEYNTSDGEWNFKPNGGYGLDLLKLIEHFENGWNTSDPCTSFSILLWMYENAPTTYTGAASFYDQLHTILKNRLADDSELESHIQLGEPPMTGCDLSDDQEATLKEFVRYLNIYAQNFSKTNYLEDFVNMVKQIETGGSEPVDVKVIYVANGKTGDFGSLDVSDPRSTQVDVVACLENNDIYNVDVVGVELGNEVNGITKVIRGTNPRLLTDDAPCNIMDPTTYDGYDCFNTSYLYETPEDYISAVTPLALDFRDYAIGPYADLEIAITMPPPVAGNEHQVGLDLECPNWVELLSANSELRFTDWRTTIELPISYDSHGWTPDAFVVHPYYRQWECRAEDEFRDVVAHLYALDCPSTFLGDLKDLYKKGLEQVNDYFDADNGSFRDIIDEFADHNSNWTTEGKRDFWLTEWNFETDPGVDADDLGTSFPFLPSQSGKPRPFFQNTYIDAVFTLRWVTEMAYYNAIKGNKVKYATRQQLVADRNYNAMLRPIDDMSWNKNTSFSIFDWLEYIMPRDPQTIKIMDKDPIAPIPLDFQAFQRNGTCEESYVIMYFSNPKNSPVSLDLSSLTVGSSTYQWEDVEYGRLEPIDEEEFAFSMGVNDLLLYNDYQFLSEPICPLASTPCISGCTDIPTGIGSSSGGLQEIVETISSTTQNIPAYSVGYLKFNKLCSSSKGRDISDLAAKVYPNPTSGTINVVSESKPDAILLYDISGKIVYEDYGIYETQNQIDLPSLLPSGAYNLVLQFKDRIENHSIYHISE